MKRYSTILLPFLLTLGVSGTVLSEEGYGAQPDAAMQPSQTAGAEFTEAELQKFVDVQQELDSIRQDYSARLEVVEDPAHAQQLQQEATQTMTQAILDEGLDIETFNQIVTAVQSDNDLLQRVMQMMN